MHKTPYDLSLFSFPFMLLLCYSFIHMSVGVCALYTFPWYQIKCGNTYELLQVHWPIVIIEPLEGKCNKHIHLPHPDFISSCHPPHRPLCTIMRQAPPPQMTREGKEQMVERFHSIYLHNNFIHLSVLVGFSKCERVSNDVLRK